MKRGVVSTRASLPGDLLRLSLRFPDFAQSRQQRHSSGLPLTHYPRPLYFFPPVPGFVLAGVQAVGPGRQSLVAQPAPRLRARVSEIRQVRPDSAKTAAFLPLAVCLLR